MAEKVNSGAVPRQPTRRQDQSVADGFDYGGGDRPLDLGASDDAPPPAYGELYDQLNLSQAGFNAGAAITDNGRVSININQTDHKLADLLAPALRSHILAPQEIPPEPLPPAYIPPNLGGQPGQTPPPQLNVVIQIVGSRGDVQPFVALGKVLKETYGHRVRIATHSVFQKFVEENGLEFFSIGGDPAELMAFMVKNPGLMPGPDALKSGEITKRRKGIEQIILGCWRSCIEAGDGLGPPPEPHQPGEPLRNDFSLPGNPESKPFVADAIIANPPSFAHIHIAEKMGIPLHMMFTMPWSPTRAFPHPLANIESSNTDAVMTNYVSYALVEMMTWQGLGDVINRFRSKVLGLEPLSLIWAPGILTRLQVPTTYCWSPALIPKPNDWGREVSVPGFYFLDLATSYNPEPDLAAFLENGPPPVYIGFGSIVVDDPNKLTRMIFDAVTTAGVRALVSKGWGGIGADSVGIPDGVFMLGNCPHDWLFKKVSCVVHHGGAGTTAAGIKTGTPTVVVPFFGDQPFWGSMIHRAGAGPAPIPYKELTAEKLAGAITTALKPETQARATELGEKIRQEKGSDLGAKSFHDFLDYDKLRCSIAPSRTAVWRMRRTQIRLSPMAATVLVNEGLLQYSDLKLYRPHEYITEEQPWDPISAVTSALVGDMGSLAMAIGDIPREWGKSVKKVTGGENTPATTPAATSGEVASGATHDATPYSRQSPPLSDSSSSAHPSILPGSYKSPDPASATGRDPSITGTTVQAQTSTSPGSSKSPSTFSKSPPPPGAGEHQGSSSQSGFNLEAAIGAGLETGKGVTRIVETGMKTPMNFCMGLAKGFRNAPKLYNDETVRKQEKVTGLASGLMLASKEFGFGLFDGVTGMVTQPYKAVEKEGGKGFMKGVGKGIGGLILKPQAGFWAIPAYAMKGLHAEVRAKFHKSVENYIIISRVLQGQDDVRHATVQEQQDVVMRFGSMRNDTKGSHAFQRKKAASGQVTTQASPGTPPGASQDNLGTVPDAPPKTGFFNTRHLPLEERRRLHALKDAWKNKSKTDAAAAILNPDRDALSAAPASPRLGAEDEEMERAIRGSVAQTSRGDGEEDAHVEAQIRASVREMRHIAEQNRSREQEMGDWKQRPSEPPGIPARTKPGMPGEIDEDVTDEEFEALIAEAVRQSLASQGVHEEGVVGGDEENQDVRRTLEESERTAGSGPGPHGDDADYDAELKRAMTESERAHQEHLARRSTERTEEEIIMEYVKKQSLAEEEHRRQKAKGKQSVGHGVGDGEEDDDEDLKRALEESLRMSGKEGGPS